MTSRRRETFSISFCDVGENHRGMKKIGRLAKSELTLKDLDHFPKGKYIDLRKWVDVDDELPEAGVYLIRGGVNKITKKDVADKILAELKDLEHDSKALMYGRVVNKKARHNLVFAEFEERADYANGKGTVVDFNTLDNLNTLYRSIQKRIPGIAVAESNHYYDLDKTYIGFHGDAERKIVVCCRFGDTFPLYYQWYYKGKEVGPRLRMTLRHGDMYAMVGTAVGHEWRKRNIYTLRHAAFDGDMF